MVKAITVLSLQRPRFDIRTVHVGHVVNKVAQRQVLLQALHFFCLYHSINTPYTFFYH
jgi:hypothetical protein